MGTQTHNKNRSYSSLRSRSSHKAKGPRSKQLPKPGQLATFFTKKNPCSHSYEIKHTYSIHHKLHFQNRADAPHRNGLFWSRNSQSCPPSESIWGQPTRA